MILPIYGQYGTHCRRNLVLLTTAFLGLLLALVALLGGQFARGVFPLALELLVTSPVGMSQLSLVTLDLTHGVAFALANGVGFVFVLLTPQKVVFDALLTITAFLVAVL